MIVYPAIQIPLSNLVFNVNKLLHFLRLLLYYGFFTITATLALLPLQTHYQYASDLSSLNNLRNKKDTGLILLDRKDRPFFSFYSPRLREEIALSDIPKHTQQAIISIEDKDFYKHFGFSPKSILRAAVINFQEKDLKYGASTITQQLAKNSLLTPEKSLIRKYKEIVLASEIESKYSKDQILESYLNSAYFGRGAFGVNEAAKAYFEKQAKQLSLVESAFLASLLPSPSSFLANEDYNQIQKRINLILQKMLEQKYISKKDADEAGKQKIKLAITNGGLNSHAPHFALMVRDQLMEKYGEEDLIQSGFKVKTSLDLDFQKFAEKAVAKQVDNLKKNNVSNGAAVVIDPKTGEILALVGSVDWFDDSFGKVNIALSERPAGSAFKPIVYVRAFEKRLITPATILQDSPTTFANFDEKTFFDSFPSKDAAIRFLSTDQNAFYKPQNYDRRFRGAVTVRRALANSLNVPSVEVMKKLGVDDVVRFASKIGITTLKETGNYGLSFVLGTAEVRLLELANFYATLANEGLYNDPTAILSIEDKYGKIIYEYQPQNKRLIDDKDAFLITSILSDNLTRKEIFGDALTINRTAAVKTGTTEDFKDAWTLGYTPSVAVGVWVGNNFGEKMDNVAGSLGAAPIWKALMSEFLKEKSIEDFKIPDGIMKQNYCLFNKEGKISVVIIEYFIKGTEPKNNCIAPTIKAERIKISFQPRRLHPKDK